MFTVTHIDVDHPVKVGDTLTLQFPFDQTTTRITRISAECGCTNPSIDNKNRLVSVNYESPGIPKHLSSVGQNSYSTTKRVEVTFTDSAHPNMEIPQVLTFTVLVVAK